MVVEVDRGAAAAAACAALVLLDLASLLALVLGLRCAHSGPLLTGGLGGCEPRRLGVSQSRLFELVEHKLDDAGQPELSVRVHRGAVGGEQQTEAAEAAPSKSGF